MKIAFCCLFLLTLSTAAYCGRISKIELNDGSIIEAEIVSLDKGVYTLNSASLGRFKIDMSKIRRIGFDATPIPVAENPPVENPNALKTNASTLPSYRAIKSEINRLKTELANDPNTMQTVAGLVLDPQFQEILKDPQISAAIKSQDIKALMENEKFLSILNNQKFREIEKELKEKGLEP